MRKSHSHSLPLYAVLFWGLASVPAQAQITPDATLPNNSIVLPDGNRFTIEGGTEAGSNLFHSFEDFSIPTGGEAFFNNALTIDNIITRITGGTFSDIDGLIRANGAANLFLINPNGIQFGPNARLDIGGSFLGSTAESLLFEDGSFYSTVEANAPPLLTVNVPVGLQMGANPGAIQVNGNGHNLTVSVFDPIERNDTPSGFQVTSNTLALVGGSITLNGGILTAESGRIELGAVDGNSQTIGVEATETGFALDYSQVQQFGDIQLRERAFVDTSGTGNGSIQVRGRNLLVEGTSALGQENLGVQPMGQIDIQTTESVALTNDDPDVTQGSSIFSETFDSGNGGDISIVTPRLTIQGNDNLIRAFTFGEADGGSIQIDAANFMLVPRTRLGSGVALRTFGTGNSGNLTIKTHTAIFEHGGLVNNVNGGSGSAGRITIEATESVELRGIFGGRMAIGSSAVSAVGNAGGIVIETPRLRVGEGSILSSSTFGTGTAGSIMVNASESIQVEGSGFNITANRVEPSQIRSAGILLSAAVQQRFGLPDTITGNAGNIVLNTPRLQVSDGANITVRHDSLGDAGNLQVNADEILLDGEGSLTASTVSGEGGNIELQVRDSLQLRHGSQIDAESFGIGNGGNVTIDSDTIALLENSQINASALEGTGGNIQMTTQGLFASPDSRITASSQFGVDGTVSINNPIVDPTSGLLTLNTNSLNPNTQVQDSCEIATKSRFTIVGSGGLPEDPTQSLQPPTVWRDTRLGEIQSHLIPNPAETESEAALVPTVPLVEATGWRRNERGQIELVAALDHLSYSSWQSHLDCDAISQDAIEPDS